MTYKYNGKVNIVSFGEENRILLLRTMANWMENNSPVIVWDILIDEMADEDRLYNGRILYNGQWIN